MLTYEKQQAIVLTSNKAFADRSQVFANDPIMASAALDRLLYRLTVVNLRGDSFLLREKLRAKAAARPRRCSPKPDPSSPFCPEGVNS